MAANFDIIAAVRDHLDHFDVKYRYDEEEEIIESGMSLNSRMGHVRLYYSFHDDGYTAYAVCGMKAAEDTRMEVMKYITMANYGLRNGNFEMDLSDGEIRYKVHTNLDDLDTISDTIIADSIMIPCRMFDRYGDELIAVMMGFRTAEEGIEKVEGK